MPAFANSFLFCDFDLRAASPHPCRQDVDMRRSVAETALARERERASALESELVLAHSHANEVCVCVCVCVCA
jgi:hypothetical protein